MPRMGGHFGGQNGGFSVTKIDGEILFQVKDFFFEARVRKRLSFGEDEATSGVPTGA